MTIRLSSWSTKLVVVGALVGAMVACSSSEAAPSAEDAFCSALAEAYSKCAGSGGALSCSDTMSGECTKVAALLNPSVLTAATTCLQAGACDSDPLVCLGKSLGEVTPTEAQTKLANTFCESCSTAPADACKTAFFGAGDVPGLGVALLPFGAAPLAAVEADCTSNPLGKTACQAAFGTCLSTTATKVLIETISVDAATCVFTGIKDGLTNAAAGTDGGPAGEACKDCAGCCKDGKCVTGTDTAACGAKGAACETCGTGDACTGGKCVSSCGPDNCAGCCDSTGQCQEGESSANCGGGGQACTTCTGDKNCTERQCISVTCQASCMTGCCTAAGCQPGNAVAACGKGGGSCSACGTGQTCSAGACKAGTTQTWDVVLVAAHLPAKKKNGDAWDAFNGLPDVFAQATSGATKGANTEAKGDSLNPSWTVTVLSDVTAASLKAQLRIEMWDDDVAFDDHVGICNIAINDASFNGALKNAKCAAAGDDVAFTIDYRLKAH